MDRRAVAAETLRIVAAGAYARPDRTRVDLSASIAAARTGTRLYRPAELNALAASPAGPVPREGRVEVTGESTTEAGLRLLREGEPDVALLNFASARNPGGGWLGGAMAQEEALARASALVTCLEAAPAYYASNRQEPSLLYTDHIIHSPRVPFFRADDDVLLDAPAFLSVITAPAPNAGQHLRRHSGDQAAVRETLARRTRHVLEVARDQAHPALVLGAWGCGVFQNDPDDVATAFRDALRAPRFAFRRVVFAVLSHGASGRNRTAFQRAFGA